MSRKLLFVSALLCALAVGSTQAGLVGYWPMDDAAGTTVKDVSGNGHDGTITGAVNWVGGAPGFRWGLQFDGSSTYVTCGNVTLDPNNKKFSVALWAKFAAGGASQYQGIFALRTTSSDQALALECSRSAVTSTTASLQFGSAYPAATYGIYTLNAGQWVHIAVTLDATLPTPATLIYINGGAPIARTGPNFGTATAPMIRIGSSESGANLFCGTIDDVRYYDTVLTASEIGGIIYPPTYPIASNPTPASGATDVFQNVSLSWTAGKGTVKEDVYLGTDPAKLTKVSSGQKTTSYVPSSKLALGTTYYWRVDDVNAGGKTLQGDLWSFTTEPVSYVLAGSSITVTVSSSGSTSGPVATVVNGTGILAGDVHGIDTKTMWVTDSKDANAPWIKFAFDKLYKLDQMWIWNYNSESEADLGYGFMDTTVAYSVDGTNWTNLYDTITLADGTSDATYACNNKISMKNVQAKYVKLMPKNNFGGLKSYGLSEVRFFWVPAFASAQSPANNATNVRPDATLTWRPGRSATMHRLFLSTDKTAVTNGTVAPFNLMSPSFIPLDLQLDSTVYYWRVDEINPAETPKIWTGDVLQFTTAPYLTVDDMESFTNDQDHGKAIFQTWIDGVGTKNNGGVVGYRVAPFAETVAVHGGAQSMPLAYTNTSTVLFSEATRQFAVPQNWAIGGATTLTLFFRPDVNNTGGQLYIKVNGVKMTYWGSLTNSSPVPMWQQWNINLSDLVNTIGSVDSITSFTVGVWGANVKGIVYIDDIRVYKTAPAIPFAMTPSTKGLIAYYAMSDNVKDGSGNGNDGTLVGAPTFTTGLSAFGKALKFNGTTDAVDLGKKAAWNPTGSFTVSFWANIGNWGTSWGHVMVSNRGETDGGVANGWQIRRGSGTGLCWTTRGVGGTDDLTGSAPALNQWIHIACVYDVAGSKAIYINGSLNLSGATTAGKAITATTTDAYLGCRSKADNTGGESFFTGMLDEVRIYNRALLPGEIYSLAGGK